MLILKQLRRKKNISQSDLASIIGVSLRTIQLYEKKDANIPIKNLNKIADYFETGIDRLYAQEINEPNVTYDAKNLDPKKSHVINKLAAGKYLVAAPLVLREEQTNFSNNLKDIKILNGLPKVSFVVKQVSVGNYMAFEVPNSSMSNDLINGIPQRSIVLGKQVSKTNLAKKIKEEHSSWILVCKNTVMCKEIKVYNKKAESITCHSLNKSPEYPDFELPIDEVLAFFQIIKKQVD